MKASNDNSRPTNLADAWERAKQGEYGEIFRSKPMERTDDIELLRPEFRQTLRLLADRLAAAGSPLRVFETYRHPARQWYLYNQKASKAQAWQSAHQYGLAADFAGHINDHWTWDLPERVWQQLTEMANDVKLARPITWDLGHIQHPNTWQIVRLPK